MRFSVKSPGANGLKGKKMMMMMMMMMVVMGIKMPHNDDSMGDKCKNNDVTSNTKHKSNMCFLLTCSEY